MTAGRLIAAAGVLECAGAAGSIYWRPPDPAIDFLPGNSVVWTVVFLAGALALALAATTGYPRAIVGTFLSVATVHAMLAFSLIGASIYRPAVGWLGGTMAGLICAVFTLEALRIARVLP